MKGTMKLKYLGIGLAALLASVCLAIAQPTPAPSPVIAQGGATGSTIASTIVSANSSIRGPAVITYVNVTSDKAGSTLKFYATSPQVLVTATNSTVTLTVANTNGFTGASAVFIIRHVLTDVYERRIVSSYTGSNTVTATVAPTFEVDPGDLIYPVATSPATIPVGAATLSLGVASGGAGGLFAGKVDANGNPLPLLIDLDGTSAVSVNTVSGFYTRAAQ